MGGDEARGQEGKGYVFNRTVRLALPAAPQLCAALTRGDTGQTSPQPWWLSPGTPKHHLHQCRGRAMGKHWCWAKAKWGSGLFRLLLGQRSPISWRP